MTSDLEDDLEKAKSTYNEVTGSLELNTAVYRNINKTFLKEKKLSPDSFMQLAFQIAYNKLYDNNDTTTNTQQLPRLPTSYESCSTAGFKHGRTETLRPSTPEIQQAIKLFRSASTPTGHLYEAMKECSNKHTTLARQASMGQGFDRHLLGLKSMANPSHLPTLFTHPSYHHLNHSLLSTSTLTSPAILAGGFAPTAKDALGIGYTVTDENIKIMLCGYPEHRNLQEYNEVLLQTFEELNVVLKKVGR